MQRWKRTPRKNLENIFSWERYFIPERNKYATRSSTEQELDAVMEEEERLRWEEENEEEGRLVTIHEIQTAMQVEYETSQTWETWEKLEYWLVGKYGGDAAAAEMTKWQYARLKDFTEWLLKGIVGSERNFDLVLWNEQRAREAKEMEEEEREREGKTNGQKSKS